MNKNEIKLPMANNIQAVSCCSSSDNQTPQSWKDQAGVNWITGHLETAVGPVYQISTTLDRRDLLGSVKARWGVGRMNYIIPPGLYAVGKPDNASPVLVSANYKLSFDHLRRELSGLALWLLVLDTKGINVWCSAGKGSFGTAEVVRMVKTTALAKKVTRRTLILPQLAAPGVSAHEVRRLSGFKVVYGPVRASDIPAYLDAGNKAEPAMRCTHFTLRDRLILTLIELSALPKPLFGLAALLFLLNLAALFFKNHPVSLLSLLGQTFTDLAPFFIAMLVGIVLVPALLPFIPGRSLAWKGFVLGILWVIGYTVFIASTADWLKITAYFLIIPSITAFLGMNFTGSTTYTSLSGVVREMEVALPLIIISISVGLVALATAYFV